MKAIFAFFMLSAIAWTQTQPTFKGHQIGETTQQFFSIAQMGEHNGQLTTDYCKSVLFDPKRPHTSVDIDGCRKVQAALGGRDAEVGIRYASELGNGTVTFHAGKLAVLSFSLQTATYDDVVADMAKKLGSEAKSGQNTYQNAFGATLVKRNATWMTDKLVATISEQKDFRYGNLGTSVIVGDRAYLDGVIKQKQSRESTLD